MTINTTVAHFLGRALDRGILSPGGQLLEFGESTIAGHEDPFNVLNLIRSHVPAARFEMAVSEARGASQSTSNYWQAVGPARAFYQAVFDPTFYLSAELGIAPRRLCIDLNGPVHFGRRFDYVINNGTSQHIFDQANFFRLMHDATDVGGLMIHWTSCSGSQWLNYGFQLVRANLFFNIAAANDYQIEMIEIMADDIAFPLESGEDVRRALQTHPELEQSVIGVMLRKTRDEPFKIRTHLDYQDGHPEQHVLAHTPRIIPEETRPNLALNRPALQSSTGKASWHHDRARDAAGGNNGMITGYYSFSTDREKEPWWMVDLGEPIPVQEVVVFNRIDTFPGAAALASGLRISLSTDGESWARVYERHDGRPIGGADGNPLRVLLYGRVARYVRLSLPDTGVLCLDEVQVF